MGLGNVYILCGVVSDENIGSKDKGEGCLDRKAHLINKFLIILIFIKIF